MSKMKILFLCTGNSCRSQMAEGWARALKGRSIEAHSAGLEKHGLNPHAVRVMAEAGVDISRQSSKTLTELGPVEFDYVVTVCGHVDENCPVFPSSTKVVHVGFEDPPRLAAHLPEGEEKLAVYRRVRDEIRRFVETLPEWLKTGNCSGGADLRSAGARGLRLRERGNSQTPGQRPDQPADRRSAPRARLNRCENQNPKLVHPPQSRQAGWGG